MRKTVHRVYWTEKSFPQSKDHHDLTEALKHSEKLRQRSKSEEISHVTISSDIAECTSLQGVDSPSPDYEWKKRRFT